MATERFNRQFILLDFEDLDNPEFMEFVRSPEFSTYLILRRYIWRSDKPHSLGLHEYYAKGLLACALSREKLAEALGGISARQVTRDINALLKRGIIKSIVTGRGNVFILGKWARDEEDQVYYEYFFLDRLHTRLDKNVQAEWTSQTGQKCPGSLDKSDHPGWTNPSTNNRESNKELNKGSSNVSKPPSSSFSKEDEDEQEILTSRQLELLIETCSREFNDLQHLQSNLTRAFNLWAKTELDEQGMIEKTLEARRITKGRISLSAVHDRGKKMAYFFAVLEDLLGLRNTSG